MGMAFASVADRDGGDAAGREGQADATAVAVVQSAVGEVDFEAGEGEGNLVLLVG
jgi:hypothetical protein